MYSMGDFTAHISASDTNDRIAAYGAYTFSGWTVALGLQDSSAATDTEITATVGGTVGPVSLGLAYAETGANVDRFVLSAGMDVGAATNVEAYYASQSNMADDSYGIDFNHSLNFNNETTTAQCSVPVHIQAMRRAHLIDVLCRASQPPSKPVH